MDNTFENVKCLNNNGNYSRRILIFLHIEYKDKSIYLYILYIKIKNYSTFKEIKISICFKQY